MRRIDRAILGLSGVAVLIHEVALVPVKADTVHQVIAFIIVGIDVFGVGCQPVLVFADEADEQVSLLYAEKVPSDALTSGDSFRDDILESALVALLTALISMRPVMVVGNRLPPWGTGNKFGQLRGHSPHRRRGTQVRGEFSWLILAKCQVPFRRGLPRAPQLRIRPTCVRHTENLR